MRRGHLEQSAAAYQRSIEQMAGPRGDMPPIAGQAVIGLGELARIKGDLERAESQFDEGIRLLEQWTQVAKSL